MRFSTTEQQRVDIYDPAYKKITTVSVEIGKWPSEPGAYGFVEATGSQRKRPDPHASIWHVSWDESDDPNVGNWKMTDGVYTKAQAKAYLRERLTICFERRKALSKS